MKNNIKLLLECLCGVLIYFSLTSCVQFPDVKMSSVDFAEKKIEIKDRIGSLFFAKGVLIFNFESSEDLLEVAQRNHASLIAWAETCDSRIDIAGLGGVYSLSKDNNIAVFNYKGSGAVKRETYNLSKNPDDICVYVGFEKYLDFFHSKNYTFRYKLNNDMISALVMYDKNDGKIEYDIKSNCKNRVCIK